MASNSSETDEKPVLEQSEEAGGDDGQTATKQAEAGEASGSQEPEPEVVPAPEIKEPIPTEEKSGEPPAPATAEYAMRTCPPPSYAEAVGQEIMTSVTTTMEYGIPPLSYVDILPKCTEKGNPAKKIEPIFDPFKYVYYFELCWSSIAISKL